jgi:Flp pilus assembly protein TadD
MKYASLALRWWRLLLTVLALGGLLLLAGCATSGYKDHFKRGGALLRQDQYAEAEKEFREAIRQVPDSESQMNLAWVYYWLGWSVEKQKRYDDAAQAYREAIRLDPNWAKPYSRLGVVLNQQGKLAEAEKVLREAVRVNHVQYEVATNLAVILDREGKRKEARIFWLKALEVDPDKERIKKRLAEPD